MKLGKKQLWLLGAIAIGVMILLTLLIAPTQNKDQLGSTYSRSPHGYGAWYNWMLGQNISIQRWQKPLTDLVSESPVTLIQVYSQPISYLPQEWISKGNTLVILGSAQKATAANFSTLHNSNVGAVKIDTRRRANELEETILLGDEYGAIVWEENIDAGKVIYATTPYLGANAYQDNLPNYRFLAQLVTKENKPIWVDEYIHGYKDQEIIQKETGNNLCRYLVNTSLFPVFVQLLLLFLLVLWGNWRSFGIPLQLSQVKQDNTQIYINALAGVLKKAHKSEYVLDTIGKHQQKNIQKALGLGESPLDHSNLTDAWVEHTHKNAINLNNWLLTKSSKRHLSETELLAWLIEGQKIRDYLENETK